MVRRFSLRFILAPSNPCGIGQTEENDKLLERINSVSRERDAYLQKWGEVSEQLEREHADEEQFREKWLVCSSRLDDVLLQQEELHQAHIESLKRSEAVGH